MGQCVFNVLELAPSASAVHITNNAKRMDKPATSYSTHPFTCWSNTWLNRLLYFCFCMLISMYQFVCVHKAENARAPSARPQHHGTNTLKHLTFGIPPFKLQVSTAAGKRFNLQVNMQCWTIFPSQMKRGQPFPIHLLQAEGILIL
jgi:hypothetical protein